MCNNEIVEVVLSDYEIEKCRVFANECIKHQQGIEFGQEDTKWRDKEDMIKDNMIGKMAEIALQKYLRSEFGIQINLDFEVYVGHDDADILYYGKNNNSSHPWLIDIKSTKTGGKLAMVEFNKLMFRNKEQKLPHFLLFCNTEWYRDERNNHGKSVKLAGFISIQKFLDVNNDKAKVLFKKDPLPGTKNTVLAQADNIYIKFEDLSRDWKSLFNYMDNTNPGYISRRVVKEKLLLKIASQI